MALQLVGETIASDKTGAATATVSWHDKEGIPDIPTSHRGLILVRRDTRQQEDGSYITVATYEGREIDSDVGSTGGGSNEANETAIYEWSPSFEQTDISKHPNISFLLSKYDGTVDESTGAVIWPKTLSAEEGGLEEDQEGETNPMFGVTSFLSLGGVWSETVYETSLTSDIFDDGYITQYVPVATTPSNRFWLAMPPIIASHGDGFKVTRRWMLSGISSSRDVEAAEDIYGGTSE